MRMTLTDELQSNSSDQVDQSVVEAGNALKTIVTEAEIENRVVNGIHSCAAQLQNCPDNVMACILADYGPLEDVTINIEHTLLEAFCMENYIKVIKVDSSKKMKKYLSTLQKNNKYPERSGDYTCILIKNPKVADEKAENTLLKFEKLHHIWGWHNSQLGSRTIKFNTNKKLLYHIKQYARYSAEVTVYIVQMQSRC